MRRPRILSVGQCGYDHGQISRQLGRQRDADVVAASTHEEALAAVREGGVDLVLVNRIGDRDGASGLDLIRAMKADPRTSAVPVMLVSNLPDAQEEAVSLGAIRGFGKAELGSSGQIAALEAALPDDR